MRSYDRRKKNNIIIGTLCAVVLLMAVGYAAFQSVLNIKGTSNISSNWNILITNVTSKNIIGGASNVEDPKWENLTATFKTSLTAPGDSIEYDITVSNKGNLNATLDKITLSDPNNEAIIFTTSGLTEGDTLAAGQSTVLTVKVEYNKNITSQPESTEGTLDVTLDFVQEGKEINSPIKNPANVEITSIEPTNIVGLASVAQEPTYYGLNANLKTNLTNQTDSLEYNITIQNQGDEDAVLTGLTVNEENKIATITSTGVTEGQTLQGNGTTVMKVKVAKSPEAPTGTVESDLNVSLEYTSNGTIGGSSAASQLIATSVTTGDGLYQDEYEEGRYIYKGANPDNYITFNNESWRILSVENDGTLKIMRKDSIGNMPWDTTNTTTGRNNANNTYCQISSGTYYGCNAWGKMEGTWTNGSKTGTVTQDASLNTYLNNDYYNSLNSESQNLIQTHTWGIGPVTFNNTDLSAQIASENGTTWSGNIGLMSTSEVLRANTNTSQCGKLSSNNSTYSKCKTTNFIIPTSSDLWIISPGAKYSREVFSVASSGYVSNGIASITSYGVAPVLYLKSDITLSGEGTETNPYTIN